jgi:Ca-activated chloride channel family protein
VNGRPPLAIVVAVLVMGVAALAAQAPRTIWVTATVTDASGRVVTSLQHQDFRIATGDDDRQDTPREVTVFSKNELPAAVSLMVDRSGSMRAQMAKARTAALLLTRVFVRGDRINIGAFDSEVAVSDRFTANRALIEWSLTRLGTGATTPCVAPPPPKQPGQRGEGGVPERGSGTAVWSGVWCGVRELTRDTESIRKVLVLITDGLDNRSAHNEGSAVKNALAEGVTIHSVGLLGVGPGHSRGDGLLRRLADTTGGLYFPVDEKDPLEPVFTRLGEELRGQYVLGFTARTSSEAGHLKVTVTDPALRVRARAQFSSR